MREFKIKECDKKPLLFMSGCSYTFCVICALMALAMVGFTIWWLGLVAVYFAVCYVDMSRTNYIVLDDQYLTVRHLYLNRSKSWALCDIVRIKFYGGRSSMIKVYTTDGKCTWRGISWCEPKELPELFSILRDKGIKIEEPRW